MASVRLTNRKREDICKAVLKNKFDPETAALHVREAELAGRVYDRAYSEPLRIRMGALPSGWLPTENFITIRAGGASGDVKDLRFSADRNHPIEKRFLYDDVRGWGNRIQVDLEVRDPLAVEYAILKQDKVRLRDKRSMLRVQIRAILWNWNTVKTLVEAWPEVEPFTRTFTPVKPNVPAVPLKQLNEALGL